MKTTDSGKASVALWALTRGACRTATRLKEGLGGGTLFVGGSVREAPGDAIRFDRLSRRVAEEFFRFRAHVFVMAAGIAVRVIAPLIRGKAADPAVVAMDDAGKFAIALLSGHLGGANRLANRAAGIVGAIPVVTTATDVRGIPALDVLAQEKGLFIENPEAVRTVAMAMLDGKRIRLHDPYGILKEELEGWTLPPSSDGKAVGEEETGVGMRTGPGVFIDHFVVGSKRDLLTLRPRTLTVGVGCNRNTSFEEIRGAVEDALYRHEISLHSIDNIATIDAKADEDGILRLGEWLGAPISFFGREELSKIETVPTPSKVVEKHMGVRSVCEAAAILGSGRGTLLAPKSKTKNATVAVAARPST